MRNPVVVVSFAVIGLFAATCAYAERAASIDYDFVDRPANLPDAFSVSTGSVPRFLAIKAIDGFRVDAALWQPLDKPVAATTLIVGVHGSGGNFSGAPIGSISPLLAAKGYGVLTISTRQHDKLINTDNFVEVRRDIEADVLDARVPPLLLQPLVENALKHGLGDRRGVLSIAAHRRDGRVELSIADDGVGLSGDGRPEGTGLRVTRERLRELYGEDQSLTLEPRSGGGAIARVSLPYRPDEAEPSPPGVDARRGSRPPEPSRR